MIPIELDHLTWAPAICNSVLVILLLTSLSYYCTLYVIGMTCLHSQLFGEEDADQEVSPDTADPEATCELAPHCEQNDALYHNLFY